MRLLKKHFPLDLSLAAKCKVLDGCMQVEAHHYCSHLNEEVRQCVIYDSAEPGARLIGIEYIISRRLFDSLPAEEKKFWHSHTFEVRCRHYPPATLQRRSCMQ